MTTKTTTPNTADIHRRRALHTLAVTLTAGNGWTRDRANAYASLLTDHDPRDVEAACHDLATTWTQRVMPPPAEILGRADTLRARRAQQAATTRETSLDRDRGIPNTVWTIRGPAGTCPRCTGILVHLTDEKLVYCHACNGVIIQDNTTGRVKLTWDEATRIPHGQVPRTMPPTPPDQQPTAANAATRATTQGHQEAA